MAGSSLVFSLASLVLVHKRSLKHHWHWIFVVELANVNLVWFGLGRGYFCVHSSVHLPTACVLWFLYMVLWSCVTATGRFLPEDDHGDQ